MGITKSKIKSNSRGNRNGSITNSPPGSQIDEYEDVELMLLRKTIQRNPESFILNNLMMCVQFFENYEENINQMKETLVSSSEAKLNKKLLPQKHVLIPDVLQEHVAQNIAFTSTRQTSRPTIEPLHPVRIYVVHDNIEITEQNCTPEYSSVNNQITYNMLVKPSEQHGYVRLELLDETPYLKNFGKRESLDPSAEEDDMYSDTDSTYYSKPKMMLSQQKSNIQTTDAPNARSLPDLYDHESIYKDHAYYSRGNLYEARSSHHIKTETSDYEHTSSASEYRRHRDKRTWSKSDLTTKPGSYQRHLRPSATKSKKINSPAGSTSSGYRTGHYAVDSDSDSSCHTRQSPSIALNYNNANGVTETACSNPKSYASSPVAEASTEIYSILNAKIPGRCFKKVMHTREGKIYDQREEKKQLLNSKQRRLRMAMRRRNYEVSYISNVEFMRHFFNLFKDQLGHPLGFSQEDLDDVKPEGSIIYCDKLMVSHNSRLCRLESYEITPSIWLQWPECAQEWLYRPRSTWPSYEDISKVKDFGCYVVPEGSQMMMDRNIHQELEWQLMFPAAERYLETCMTHSQAQVYFIALMLHKTFLRPVFDSMYYLTTSDIRNKMFWLIEQEDRPSKWPENRTGECLIKLLKSLYRCLCQNEPVLWDYFIRDKNIFHKVPADHLLHTQKQLKRILENPVMYVLHAMENIRHSEKFFPRLDYEMLLKILTMDTLALVNPALSQCMLTSPSRSSDSHMARDEIYNRPGGFWDSTKSQTEQKIYARVVTNKTLINTRKATDSIIEITVRCAELESPRLGALLDFFVRHFIKMAERCHQYQAYQQKKVYLEQADRLSIILSELVRYKDDAKAYRDKIAALKTRTTRSRTISSQKEAPETPKRNGEAPLFVSSLKDRFTKETTEASAESKSEQPQSSRFNREVRKNKVVQAAEVRFQQEGKEDVKEKTTKVKESSETTSILKKSANKNQTDESASKVINKGVVSLASNKNESFLTETTYI